MSCEGIIQDNADEVETGKPEGEQAEQSTKDKIKGIKAYPVKLDSTERVINPLGRFDDQTGAQFG